MNMNDQLLRTHWSYDCLFPICSVLVWSDWILWKFKDFNTISEDTFGALNNRAFFGLWIVITCPLLLWVQASPRIRPISVRKLSSYLLPFYPGGCLVSYHNSLKSSNDTDCDIKPQWKYFTFLKGFGHELGECL